MLRMSGWGVRSRVKVRVNGMHIRHRNVEGVGLSRVSDKRR
jgi:hypothetical protein